MTIITDANGTRTVKAWTDLLRECALIPHPAGGGHWIAPVGWSECDLRDDMLLIDDALMPIGSDCIPPDYRHRGPHDRAGEASYCWSVRIVSP